MDAKNITTPISAERREELKLWINRHAWTSESMPCVRDILSFLDAKDQWPGPKKVTRERVQYWIPCNCDVAYTSRGLTAHDCPFHGYSGWEDLLNELGIEVNEAPEEKK